MKPPSTPLRLLPLLLATALWSCATPQPQHPPGVVPYPQGKTSAGANEAPPLHLTLVGTNDLHGWVHPHRVKLPDGTEYDEGGMAAFAGYVKILREENPKGTLLLDGGDMFQGTLASNLSEGAVMMEVLNQLGYTAAAVGNHEFDYGPVGPAALALEPGQDPVGALKARIKQAKFPLLAVNIYDAATGQRPEWLGNDGTTMVDLGAVKVGVLGLATPTTPTVTNPVHVAALRFGNLVPEALSAAKRLREQGADVVVAVAHAGTKCASVADPHDTSSCDPSGEINELLTGLPPGTLDAVIAGHTHTQVGHFINGTPVIETWGLATTFGTIDLYLDPVRRTVLPEKTRIRAVIPICTQVDAATRTCESRKLRQQASVSWVPATFHDKPVVADAQVNAMLAPALARVEAEQRRPLGVRVPKALTRSYEAESPLGSALADALREMEKADVALMNSGGLRSDVPAGELTFGNVYEVLPFDNTIATLTLTGEELQRLLLSAYGAKKGVFQQSGLQITLSRCPTQNRLRAVTLANGKPIQPTAVYRVVTSDFLVRGGDGLGPVMTSVAKDKIDLGERRPEGLREALVSFWKKKGGELTAPRPGRTVLLSDGDQCGAGAKLDPQAPPPPPPGK
jgi:5'-nucleotidase